MLSEEAGRTVSWKVQQEKKSPQPLVRRGRIETPNVRKISTTVVWLERLFRLQPAGASAVSWFTSNTSSVDVTGSTLRMEFVFLARHQLRRTPSVGKHNPTQQKLLNHVRDEKARRVT